MLHSSSSFAYIDLFMFILVFRARGAREEIFTHGRSFSDFLSALLPTLALGRGFSDLSSALLRTPFASSRL